MDAKDILGLPKTPITGSLEKKSRPHKESHRKPDGISREVYALTGGLAPLMPWIDVNQIKCKTQTHNDKVAWQWLPFTNSARKDKLQLYHWVRVVNNVPPTGEYLYAKYNKSVDLNKYTDDEYEKYLQDPMWTKEETDQLFELCERFDLRFIIIADRFPTSRSVEDLKDRYYKVSRAVLVARAPTYADVAAHPLVKEPYNITQETERKRALSMILSQTKQQERRDAEIIAKAKRISEARKAEKQAKEREVVIMSTGQEGVDRGFGANDAVIEAPNAQIPSTSVATSESEIAATLASLCMLRVYLRTYGLDQMVQAVNSSAGLRTIKRVEQTLQDLVVPTKAVCAEHLELRKEILTLLNLQKQLQDKEAEGPSCQEGSYSESPDTPPKRSQRGMDNDRPFTPDSFNIGGDRIGKRDQKRKGTPSSPSSSKRPWKLKTDG